MNGSASDILVIGGGFFGTYLAQHMAQRGLSVTLLEADGVLLGRASLVNQARVHNGYHYPRSILTGLRSRENYERFRSEFEECVHDTFTHHYAIARNGSNITPQQFALFCDRIGAEHREVKGDERRHFNTDMVSAVFHVKEGTFDAVRLRERMQHELARTKVRVLLNSRAMQVRRAGDQVEVVLNTGERLTASRVVDCTYAGMNDLLVRSGLPPVPLMLEIVEIALLNMPADLAGLGWTIMDGPFCGCLPFPSRQATSLYHVRYSSHGSWLDDGSARPRNEVGAMSPLRESRLIHMMKDLVRFVPAAATAEYLESLWVTRAKLPGSSTSDSRPILYLPCPELPQLVHVMGGKIDNVYDVLPDLDASLAAR